MKPGKTINALYIICLTIALSVPVIKTYPAFVRDQVEATEKAKEPVQNQNGDILHGEFLFR